MIGRTNVGGGGGKIYALISVTYPSGSTCLCSNGTKTLEAEDTSGSWVFAVTEAGLWTVSCSDGVDSDSKTVSITAEGQIESIALTYRLYLYDNGTQLVSFGYFTQSNASINFNSSYIATSGGQNNGISGVYTNNKVDMSDYSKLYFEVEYRDNNNTNYPLRMGATSNNGSGSWTFAAVVQPTVNSGVIQTVFADISSLSGNYYVGYRGTSASRVYAIYLE